MDVRVWRKSERHEAKQDVLKDRQRQLFPVINMFKKVTGSQQGTVGLEEGTAWSFIDLNKKDRKWKYLYV